MAQDGQANDPEPEAAGSAGQPADGRPDWLVNAEEGVRAEMSSRPVFERPVLRVPGSPHGAAATPNPGPHPGPPRINEIEQMSVRPSGLERPDGGALLGFGGVEPKEDAHEPPAPARPHPADNGAWGPRPSSVPTIQGAGQTPVDAAASAARREAEALLADWDLAPPNPEPRAPRPVVFKGMPKEDPPPSSSGSSLGLLLVLLVVAVVVGGVVLFFTRDRSTGGPTERIASIKAAPNSFDGRSVRLRGKVGQVFRLGGSHAFYLHQGRDTIVVFSRTRVPIETETITLVGSVSSGVLDGVARAAVFESP